MNHRSHSALSAIAILCLSSACASPRTSWEQGTRTAATPQRPTYSSSTFTTAAGTIEVEGGLAIDRNDSLATPATVKYGVDDRSEAFIGLTPGVAVAGAGVGFGDVQLGWRQRLTELQVGSLSLAYQAYIKLPTANENRGLGNGDLDAFAAGIATIPLDRWSVTGFTELGLVGHPTKSGSDVHLAIAGAADRAMTSDTSLFGELAGIFIDDQDIDAIFTTVGGTWSPVPGLVLDAAFLVGLNDDAPDFQVLVGFTRNIGRASGYAARRNW